MHAAARTVGHSLLRMESSVFKACSAPIIVHQAAHDKLLRVQLNCILETFAWQFFNKNSSKSRTKPDSHLNIRSVQKCVHSVPCSAGRRTASGYAPHARACGAQSLLLIDQFAYLLNTFRN